MRSSSWQGPSWVMVNREPVLTLSATVVAELLGFGHDEAPSLGRTVVDRKNS